MLTSKWAKVKPPVTTPRRYKEKARMRNYLSPERLLKLHVGRMISWYHAVRHDEKNAEIMERLDLRATQDERRTRREEYLERRLKGIAVQTGNVRTRVLWEE